MQIQIHARNFTVNQRLQDYVEKKVNKLDKFLPQMVDQHSPCIRISQKLANRLIHRKRGSRFSGSRGSRCLLNFGDDRRIWGE